MNMFFLFLKVYIHCDLKVCDLGECPLPTNCGSSTRRKRSTLISFSRHVFAGPISMRKTESAGKLAGFFHASFTSYASVSTLHAISEFDIKNYNACC